MTTHTGTLPACQAVPSVSWWSEMSTLLIKLWETVFWPQRDSLNLHHIDQQSVGYRQWPIPSCGNVAGIKFHQFNVYGSVRCNNILIYIQQDATLHSLFISGNCCTFFGWYHHPSSGAHTTVSTASGICHTVTAICHYRGRVGTGLSVLWVG
jgi:hypothetical protein